MKYQITAIWNEDLHETDIIRAREAFELDLIDSMEHLEFEGLRIDLAPLPVEAGGQTVPIPEAGVIHPWDQGLWIFPEDHPLAEYERIAKASGASREAKEEFQRAGMKMLPPGDEADYAERELRAEGQSEE